MITLTAVPQARSYLASWTGCSSLSGLSCNLTLSANTFVSASFVVGTSTVAPLNVAQLLVVASSTPISMPAFTRQLVIGSRGLDVQNLQRFLNSQGFMVSKSGIGSPGNESDYFGPATKIALASFQTVYASQILTPAELSSATGFFGPSTIRVVNSMLKK